MTNADKKAFGICLGIVLAMVIVGAIFFVRNREPGPGKDVGQKQSPVKALEQEQEAVKLAEANEDPQEISDIVEADYGKGKIIVTRLSHKLVLLRDDVCIPEPFPVISYEENGVETKPIGKRIRIAGKVEKISFVRKAHSEFGPAAIWLESHGIDPSVEDYFVFDVPGVSQRAVNVGKVSIKFSYVVIRLPIAEGMSTDEVIDIYGMPNRRTPVGGNIKWEYAKVSVWFDENGEVWAANVP